MTITFILSLVLIVLLFSVKLFELRQNKKTVMTHMVRKGDFPIKKFFLHLKKEVSHITWNNFARLMIYLSRLFHKRVTIFKRRFDSRQPRFLIASTPEALNRNNSKKPSIFLREIVNNKHDRSSKKV